jgi:hypothetical protein
LLAPALTERRDYQSLTGLQAAETSVRSWPPAPVQWGRSPRQRQPAPDQQPRDRAPAAIDPCGHSQPAAGVIVRRAEPFDHLGSPLRSSRNGFDHPCYHLFDHPFDQASTPSITPASIPPYPPSARLRSLGSLGLALAIKPGAPPERVSNRWMAGTGKNSSSACASRSCAWQGSARRARRLVCLLGAPRSAPRVETTSGDRGRCAAFSMFCLRCGLSIVQPGSAREAAPLLEAADLLLALGWTRRLVCYRTCYSLLRAAFGTVFAASH